MRAALSFFTLVLGVTGCLRPRAEAVPAPPVADTAATRSLPESFLVTVPDANWRIELVRVYERDDAVWVLARVRREPGPAAQSLRSLRCEIPVTLPSAKPRRVFVAGKTWTWANEEPVEFVTSLETVEKNAANARVLFPAP